jgi:hypothetical protein
MLFSNIDITGSIMAFTLINVAKDSTFQNKLLSEIRAKEQTAGYDVGEYVARQDTLLHFATLESIRVTPAMCMFSFYFVFVSCFSSLLRINPSLFINVCCNTYLQCLIVQLTLSSTPSLPPFPNVNHPQSPTTFQ